MTPKDFLKKMNEISRNNEPEESHIEADALMVDLLKSLGYADGATIFEKMSKWYA